MQATTDGLMPTPLEDMRRSARFPGFEFDLRSGELRADGKRVAVLAGQPFQLLLALLERPGEVVLREDLQQRLWAGDTVVEYDHSINVAINKLRKWLGDKADEPRYIETVASRGYRWVAAIEWPAASAEACARGESVLPDSGTVFPLDHSTADRQPQKEDDGTRRAWMMGIGALALAALAGFGWRAYLSGPRGLPAIRLRQLTSNSDELPVRTSAMSPDGKYIAYSDKQGVHIKAIETEETTNVAQPAELKGQRIDWQIVARFPDSTRFVANIGPLDESCLRCEPFSAWSFSVRADHPHKLRDDVNVEAVSPDGSLLAYTTDLDILGGRQIILTQADGAQPVKVMEANRESLFRFVRFSPDGERLSFIYDENWQDPRRRSTSIESSDLRGGARVTLTQPEDIRGIHDYVWLTDGRIVYGSDEFAKFEQGCNYWEIRVGRGERPPVTKPLRISNWGSSCVSWTTATSDARHVSFVRSEDDSGVYVAELRGERLIPATMRRLTLRSGFHQPIAWSPDGNVVYVPTRAKPVVGHLQAGFE